MTSDESWAVRRWRGGDSVFLGNCNSMVEFGRVYALCHKAAMNDL